MGQRVDELSAGKNYISAVKGAHLVNKKYFSNIKTCRPFYVSDTVLSLGTLQATTGTQTLRDNVIAEGF